MTSATSPYTPGNLVRARGRDWVVLPSREPLILRLRPLTGGDDESVELFLPLEDRDLAPSTFPEPDPTRAGDAVGVRLLFNAARLGLRSTVAPFRALARIGVVPRPYQFVPLLMALRQRIVRLLIADDVGVGKTIEAALVARELLDRGLARRLLVLCPPHLCAQWKSELREKFGIEAVVVQPATIGALERQLPRPDLNVYAYYPYIVASIDYVKNERVKRLLLPQAPDLVIVDEAHAAARPPGQRGRDQQLRYTLLRDLMRDGRRHLILVTATPHSGIEESFRSLLGLLDERFDPPPGAGDADLPPLDPGVLANYIVQRRRADLVSWLGQTRFPERRTEERFYKLRPRYQHLFESVLRYCHESVADERGLTIQKQRVRYWAALALLRCVLSSPAAAVAVLESRAVKHAAADDDEADDNPAAIDARYRQQVPDPADDAPTTDSVPAAPLDDPLADYTSTELRRLQEFCREARALFGAEHDAKLVAAADALRSLLAEHFRPIVFCRYIDTATYLAEQLPRLLAERGYPEVSVVAVTGEQTEEVRAERVRELAAQPCRVLVATDCLSEGINLQDDFDAVLHYDLPWNPNRLEQREGRVDRFGQTRDEVRAVVLYGDDNPLDITVLNVLVRKARAIREQLGITVPVPLATEDLLDVLVEKARIWLRSGAPREQGWLIPPDEPHREAFEREIDRAAALEREARTRFAQRAIPPDVVERELQDVDLALGSPDDVHHFLANVLKRLESDLVPTRPEGSYALEIGGRARKVLKDHGGPDALPERITFVAPPPQGVSVISRTSPLIAALADYVVAAAFRAEPGSLFSRCGAMITSAVSRRTIVLLLRLRYWLRERGDPDASALDEYGEEVRLTACVPEIGALAWLTEPQARELFETAQPVQNPSGDARAGYVRWALDLLKKTPAWHRAIVEERRGALIQAHARVRARFGAPPLEIEAHPPDILACFVLVPPGDAS